MKYSLAGLSDIKTWSLIGSAGVLLSYSLFARSGLGDSRPLLAPLAFCLLAGGALGAAIPLVFSIPCRILISEEAARTFEGMLQRSDFALIHNEGDLVDYRACKGGFLQRLTAFTNTVVFDRSSVPVCLRFSWYYRLLVWNRLGIKEQ